MQKGLVPRHFQAPFGGELLPFFRHQGHQVGFHLPGDVQHLRGGGHLEVEAGLDGLAQQFQVPVLDVAPVFPQVDDDAVGPGQLRQGRGRHRVRLIDEAGLAQGGHMINVYFQSRHAVSPFKIISVAVHFFMVGTRYRRPRGPIPGVVSPRLLGKMMV